jgi:hypothetical protein
LLAACSAHANAQRACTHTHTHTQCKAWRSSKQAGDERETMERGLACNEGCQRNVSHRAIRAGNSTGRGHREVGAFPSAIGLFMAPEMPLLGPPAGHQYQHHHQQQQAKCATQHGAFLPARDALAHPAARCCSPNSLWRRPRYLRSAGLRRRPAGKLERRMSQSHSSWSRRPCSVSLPRQSTLWTPLSLPPAQKCDPSHSPSAAAYDQRQIGIGRPRSTSPPYDQPFPAG